VSLEVTITPQIPQAEPRAKSTSGLGLLFRLFWIVVGHVVLGFLAIFIFQSGVFSFLDVAYWLVVAGMIAIRFFDITRLRGQTADGELATLSHWRRYTLLLLLVFGGAWVLVHVFGVGGS
jgi:hypothetical protein